MKAALAISLALLFAHESSAAISYWFENWQPKPDARQAAAYFMVPGAGITFTYANNRVVINAVGGPAPTIQLFGDVTSPLTALPNVTATLINTGTAGTYVKTTFDAQGRETSGVATLANADLDNSSLTYNGVTVSLGGSGTLLLSGVGGDFLNEGSTTTVLHGNAAGTLSFGAVNLGTDVTGTLPGVWLTAGNTGAGNFLGSTDAEDLEFRVDNDQIGLLTTFGSVAFGTNAIANGNASVALGYKARATNEYSVAVGPNTHAEGNSSMAVGSATFATGIGAAAIGVGSIASGQYASAFGANSQAIGNGSLALTAATSGGPIANGASSVAIGSGTTANQGSFVYGDTAALLTSDTAANQFIMNSRGGAQFYTGGNGVGIYDRVGKAAAVTIQLTNGSSWFQRAVYALKTLTGEEGVYYIATNNGIATALNTTNPVMAWGTLSAWGAGPFVPATVTANTYYRVTNYVYSATNRWALDSTMTNGILRNDITGWYRIGFSVSAHGNTGNEMEADVVTNGVNTDAIAAHWTTSTAGKSTSGSGSGILFLTNGSSVSLAVKNIDSTSLTITHAQLTVGSP